MPFDPKRFTLTAEHVKLLRRAYVRWEDCEFGAPAIDCKRPYGNSSDVLGDMAEILGLPVDDDGEWLRVNGAEDRLNVLHRETQTALQIVLATGRFEPGEYEAPAYSARWEAVG